MLIVAGCKEATQTGSTGTYVAEGQQAQQQAPVTDVATTCTSAAVGQGKLYVELANPQSDDQGNYVPVRQDSNYSLMGYASGQQPVAQVMVNDVEAATYPADYRPYGSPEGYHCVGFRAPLVLSPDTIVTIALIDANGYRETRLFHPDRVRAPGRVHQLWGQSRNDPYSNVRLANVYMVQGDYANAYPFYHRSTLTAGFMWGSFFLGVALYNNNRYDDSMWQYRRCSRMRPDFYVADYEIGRCWERRGRYDLAISAYGLVLARQPRFVEAHWSMGESYAQRGDWSRASNEYTVALQYDQRFAPAHRGMGEVYAHQGQWDNARTSLVMATNLNPRDARARADLNSSMAHQQRSPKQFQIAMLPLKAPNGYQATAAQNTRSWQGHGAGGQQQGAGVRQANPAVMQQQGSNNGHRQQGQAVMPSGVQQQQRGQAARTSGAQQQRGQAAMLSGMQMQQGSGNGHQQSAKPSATQQHGQSAKPSGGGHQQSAKPSGGGHQQSAKPSGGGHQQSARTSGGGHAQASKPSGGGHQQSAKSSGGGHAQAAKPSGGGHAQAKKSGGQQAKGSGGQHAQRN